RKKDSTNKWVYYTLTDKGEHLFKPQFYSWVVVFSLSIVFIFVGLLRMFNNSGGTLAATAAKESDMLAQGAPSVAGVPITVPTDYTGYLLIALGVIGIIYLVYRKYKK
ncbi:MAG: hypothetical protein AABX14_03135, partial [Candidatus Aenigmatarchaeota archaeon]